MRVPTGASTVHFSCFSPAGTPHERSHELSHKGVHGLAHGRVQSSGQFPHILFSHVVFCSETLPLAGSFYKDLRALSLDGQEGRPRLAHPETALVAPVNRGHEDGNNENLNGEHQRGFSEGPNVS